MGRRKGYSAPQIVLHWAIAVLVAFNFIYSDGMGRALHARLDDRPMTGLDLNPAIHVWVGVLVLGLVILRLALRFGRGVPEPGGQGLQQSLAHWGHRLIYLLLLCVPVLGGLTWFGRLDPLGDPHALLANVLMILAGGHALVAIWHQLVLKDGLLGRMFRPEGN